MTDDEIKNLIEKLCSLPPAQTYNAIVNLIFEESKRFYKNVSLEENTFSFDIDECVNELFTQLRAHLKILTKEFLTKGEQ